MTSQLAEARRKVKEAEAALDEARADLRRIAIEELQREVSVSRIAREIGMTRASVSAWARAAGIEPRRASPVEPRELGK
ncbi:hypothetical protein [Saccharopolyspora shandongensis]|uniref:hypothetical protein n=1 Tax=Saccharopolyspora shandongensis TaxID=418495 RepID=UPI0033D0BC90